VWRRCGRLVVNWLAQMAENAQTVGAFCAKWLAQMVEMGRPVGARLLFGWRGWFGTVFVTEGPQRELSGSRD